MAGAGKDKGKGTDGEQYFSSTPDSADVRRKLTVTLRDHEAQVETSNGVFSGNRLDLGTSVLLRLAPDAPQTGEFLDLGCGWGPVALTLAFESPEAHITAIDVNERALELTAANAKANGCANISLTQTDADGRPLEPQPAALPDGTPLSPVPADRTFDLIWSNPPIRIGKEALHTLLMAWLPRLKPQGAAYLVVQKNLGADSLIPWLADALGENFTVAKAASSKGFRIIEILRNR